MVEVIFDVKLSYFSVSKKVSTKLEKNLIFCLKFFPSPKNSKWKFCYIKIFKKKGKKKFAYVLEHCASFASKSSIWPLLKGAGEWVLHVGLGNAQFETSLFKLNLTVVWKVLGLFPPAIFHPCVPPRFFPPGPVG